MQQREQAEVFGGEVSGEDKGKPKGKRKWSETKKWWNKENNKDQLGKLLECSSYKACSGRWLKISEASKNDQRREMSLIREESERL